jgi:hypothetical protein
MKIDKAATAAADSALDVEKSLPGRSIMTASVDDASLPAKRLRPF